MEEDKSQVCEHCGKDDIKNMGSHLRFCEEAKKAAQQQQADKPEVKRRRKGQPLGVRTRKLGFEPIDKSLFKNYQLRWINDRGNRLMAAENGDYEFVMKNEGVAGGSDVSHQMQQGADSRVSTVVGTDEGGRPIRAYLMKIRKEYYDEDQKTKQKEIDKMEMAILRGQDKHGRPGVEGRYLPEDAPGKPIMESSIRSFRE